MMPHRAVRHMLQRTIFMSFLGGFPTTLLLRNSVDRQSLLRLPYVSRRIWAQPQSDVGGLHRLPHHTYQVVAQGVQVCFVSQRCREGLKSLSSIVLAAVEATINYRLYAAAEGIE